MAILLGLGDEDGLGEVVFFFGVMGRWSGGKEEDFEGLIPQGPSGNSIGFWSSSQRNLSSAVKQNIFCKIMFTTRTQSSPAVYSSNHTSPD